MKDPILVINSYKSTFVGWKPAMLLNSESEQEVLACFERDQETAAYFSCSINWNNQLFIFGGHLTKHRRQISRLTGHKLERLSSSLDFDHARGACSVMGKKVILLCFGSDNKKRCKQSTGPLDKFSDVPLSKYDHFVMQTSCSDSKLKQLQWSVQIRER